jgi:hypothetical protein
MAMVVMMMMTMMLMMLMQMMMMLICVRHVTQRLHARVVGFGL